jgi:uncharacterized protein (DUF2336 family)
MDSHPTKPLFEDTSPEVERILIERIRLQSPARRFAMARALTGMAVRLAMVAIRRANPCFTEEDVRRRFAELHHGLRLPAIPKTAKKGGDSP